MKNFYFLIVFILGTVFGIGCVFCVQKYVLQDEKELAPKEVVFEMQPDTTVASSTIKNIKLSKDEYIKQNPVIDEPEAPKAQEKSHTFFAMFSSLTILCALIGISFVVNANQTDRTKTASIFFGIMALASGLVAYLCY